MAPIGKEKQQKRAEIKKEEKTCQSDQFAQFMEMYSVSPNPEFPLFYSHPKDIPMRYSNNQEVW